MQGFFRGFAIWVLFLLAATSAEADATQDRVICFRDFFDQAAMKTACDRVFSDKLELEDNRVLALARRDGHHFSPIKPVEKVAGFDAKLPFSATNHLALFSRGVLHNREGRCKEALAAFDAALKIRPTYGLENRDFYIEKSNAYSDLGDVKKAMEAAEMAIELFPQYPLAHTTHGILNYKRGFLGLAIANFTRSIELDPADLEIFFCRYAARLALKNYDAALSDLGRVKIVQHNFTLNYWRFVELGILQKNYFFVNAIVNLSVERYPNDDNAKRLQAESAALIAAHRKDINASLGIDDDPMKGRYEAEKQLNDPKPALLKNRVALVFGNSAYSGALRLKTAANDAKAIADAFQRKGFIVTLSLDADIVRMKSDILRFSSEMRAADAAVVYYAGRAFQSDKLNYLMPVEASFRPWTELQKDFIPVEELLRSLVTVNGVGLLFIDACRDNSLTRNSQGIMADILQDTLFPDTGLVEMKAANVIVTLSAQPNEVTFDGAVSDHSSFAEALLSMLEVPQLNASQLAQGVVWKVQKASNGGQMPSVSNDTSRTFILTP